MVDRASDGLVGGMLKLPINRSILGVEGTATSIDATRRSRGEGASCVSRTNLVIGCFQGHLQMDAMIHVISQFQRHVPHQFMSNAQAGLEAVGVLVVRIDAVSYGRSRRSGVDPNCSEVSRSQAPER